MNDESPNLSLLTEKEVVDLIKRWVEPVEEKVNYMDKWRDSLDRNKKITGGGFLLTDTVFNIVGGYMEKTWGKNGHKLAVVEIKPGYHRGFPGFMVSFCHEKVKP